jgi:hypothetical protein
MDSTMLSLILAAHLLVGLTCITLAFNVLTPNRTPVYIGILSAIPMLNIILLVCVLIFCAFCLIKYFNRNAE